MIALLACAAALGAISVRALAGLTPVPIEFQVGAGKQVIQSTRNDATTSSTSFSPVPGLSGVGLCNARSGVSVTTTMELSGAPVEIRALMGPRKRVLEPGPLSLDPGASPGTTFSATFVRAKGIGLPDGPYTLQWRSKTGAPATMTNGTIRILFSTARHTVNCD